MRTKEEIRNYQKQWHKKNPDYNTLYSSKWRQSHYSESLKYHRDYGRKWRKNNKEKTRESVKKSYYKHHQKRLADRRRYYAENKTKENKYRVRLAMKAYYSDPKVWITMNLRSRLIRKLNMKTVKIRKSSPTLKLLGANLDVIKEHLERQFTKGMSWDNRGLWHIDHIKPLSLFDLRKPTEQLEAMNYKNLQPLWAKDNLIKGAKYKTN